MNIDTGKLKELLIPLATILDDLDKAGLYAAGNNHIRVIKFDDVVLNVGHLRVARLLLGQIQGTRSPSRFVQADLLRTWCARDDPRSAYVHIGDSITRMGYRKVEHISKIADDLWDVLVDGDMHTNAMTGDTSIFVREDTS